MTDHAIVQGCAVVNLGTTVKGNARLGGCAKLINGARLEENAVVCRSRGIPNPKPLVRSCIVL